MTLTPRHGTISLLGAAAIVRNGDSVTVSGRLEDINATLDSLVFTGQSGFTDATLVLLADDADASTHETAQTLSIQLASSPANAVPVQPILVAGVRSEVIGLGVSDLDNLANSRNLTVTLTPTAGTVQLTPFGSATLSAAGTVLTLTGSVTDVDRTLQALDFTADKNVTRASLLIETADGNDLTPDARNLLLMDVVSPPENTLPAQQTVQAGAPVGIPGVSVSDFDSAELQVTLTPSNGSIAVIAAPGVTLTPVSEGGLRIFGSQSAVNATLSTLSFTGSDDFTDGRIDMLSSDLSGITPVAHDILTLAILHSPRLTLPDSPSIVAGTVVAIPGISVKDSDGQVLSVTLTPSDLGSLSLNAAAGATVTDVDGVTTVTGFVDAVNATLAGLRYSAAAEATATATITVSSSDGDARSTGDDSKILTVNLLQQPVVSAPEHPLAVSGQAETIAGISITDAGTELLTATVRVGTGGSIVLTAAEGAAVADSGDGVTITGSPAAVNATLATLSFTGAGAAGSVSITVEAEFNDSQLGIISKTFDVVVVDAPTQSLPVVNSIAVVGEALAIGGIRIADADSDNLTVTLSASHGQINLSGDNVSDLNGVKTVSGTPEQVNATLASLSYTATAGGSEHIVVTTSDGVIGNNAATPDANGNIDLSVAVRPTLERPVDGIVVLRNQAVTLSGIRVADSDSNRLTLSLTPTGGSLSYTLAQGVDESSADGVITLSGSPEALNLTLDSLSFSADHAAPRASLAVAVIDENRLQALGNGVINLRITDQSAPAAGGDRTVTALVEDAQPNAVNVSFSPTRLDRDVNQPIAIRILSVTGGTVTDSQGQDIILGAGGTVIKLNAGVADLRFTPAANLDTEGGLRYVMVDADLPNLNSAASRVTLPLIPVNDAPVITSGDSATVAENTAAGTVIYTATATDVEHQALTWSLSGTDAEAFRINRNGEVSLKAPADFETKADYSFNLIATDSGSAAGAVAAVKAGQGGAGSASSSKTITIHIGDVNESPMFFSGDSASVAENSPAATVVYSALAADPEKQAVTYSLSGVDAALLSIDADSGAVRLRQSADFEAKATYNFSVTATDPAQLSSSRNVRLTVTDVNDNPRAQNDAAAVSADSVLNVSADVGVLVNDSDSDRNSTLFVSQVNGSERSDSFIVLVSGAKLNMNADGSYSYDPSGRFDALAAGQIATDSFSYTVSDGRGGSASATVTLSVRGVNDAPSAVADSATGAANATLTVNSANGVLANDSDPDSGDNALQVSALNGNSGVIGQVTTLASGAQLTLNSDGSYVYVPGSAFVQLNQGEIGFDSFSYTVSDSQGGSSTATVSIELTGVNDAPLAVSDSLELQEGQVFSVGATGLLANDGDVDHAAVLRITQITSEEGASFDIADGGNAVLITAQGAQVTVGADGAFSYDQRNAFAHLAAGVDATDRFSYTVTDEHGAAVITTVTLTIHGGNTAPTVTATERTVSVVEHGIFEVPAASGLLFGAADVDDGAQLRISAVDGLSSSVDQTLTLASGARLIVHSDGAWSYDGSTAPNQPAKAVTTDSFRYTLTDQQGASQDVVVHVLLRGVNDAPSLNGTLQTLNGTDENTVTSATPVLAIVTAGGWADLDPGAVSGIAVTATVGRGVWQYSTDGVGWTDFGPVSAAHALLLSSAMQTRYIPDGDDGESAGFSYRSWDQTGGSASVNGRPSNADTGRNGAETAFSANLGRVDILVDAVNDAPGFSKGPDQRVTENAGLQIVNNWATELSKGPAAENSQLLSFIVVNDNNALFSIQPSIDSHGTLSYAPAAGASGNATVTVTVKDNGGSAHGGVDRSGEQVFSISVNRSAPISVNLSQISGNTDGRASIGTYSLTYAGTALGTGSTWASRDRSDSGMADGMSLKRDEYSSVLGSRSIGGSRTVVVDMKLSINAGGHGRSSGGHFSLPSSVFAGLDRSGPLSISGIQAGGQRLPSWISVNPGTGAVTVQDGAIVTAPITVKITVRDSQGEQVVVLVKVQPQTKSGHVKEGGAPHHAKPQASSEPPEKNQPPHSEAQPIEKSGTPIGKPGLTQQLQKVGRKGFEQQRGKLLDSLADLDRNNRDAA